MTNPERLIFKGQLSEAKHKKRELEIRLRGTLLQIRNVLNPYVDISIIDTESLASLTSMFVTDHAALVETSSRIAELEDALNG